MLINRNNISLIDAAYILWVLCLIDNWQSKQKPLTIANIRNEFGERATKSFIFYTDMATAIKLLKGDLELTDKGNKIVKRWKQISQKIYDMGPEV